MARHAACRRARLLRANGLRWGLKMDFCRPRARLTENPQLLVFSSCAVQAGLGGVTVFMKHVSASSPGCLTTCQFVARPRRPAAIGSPRRRRQGQLHAGAACVHRFAQARCTSDTTGPARGISAFSRSCTSFPAITSLPCPSPSIVHSRLVRLKIALSASPPFATLLLLSE